MFSFLKKLFSPAESADSGSADAPITPAQIAMVQESWEKVKPIAPQAADLFYNKLFELDPAVKPLFTTPQEEQGKKLMATISVAVAGLTNLESIVPTVQELGRKHVEYKVTPEMYDTVAAALLWTLEQGLGDAWNDELKAAWVATYTIVADTMKAAAAEVTPSEEAEEEGPLTARQIELVQTSWEKVVPIADTAAGLFYGQLFKLDPEVKKLFTTDQAEQGKKLMTMITTAVRGLNDLEAIVPAVQSLGKRHVEYKVQVKDYGTVAEALLWTLGQGLGDAFDEETKEAWTAVYGLLAKVMIDASDYPEAA